MDMKMKRVARGRGPAYEVYRLSKRIAPTRFAYSPGLKRHNGKLVRERLGFKGNKVVEIGFVMPKKRK
jgi:hypothetical protein